MEWAYWCASEKLDPMGGHTELASLVATQVINTIRSLAAGLGNSTLDEDDLLPTDAFVPFRHENDDAIDAAIESLEAMRGI